MASSNVPLNEQQTLRQELITDLLRDNPMVPPAKIIEKAVALEEYIVNGKKESDDGPAARD